ncbi:transposase [Bifidobacterium breve]|uniref:transposase n=1 Tax=Bifidobacterium breve TaxID=1685 RepID=UPI0032DEBC41
MFNDQEKTAKKRLMNRIFNRLLNVKGTVVEDARIADSPLRSEPVLEIRVRPRAGMLRCSRCGERRHGYDQGGGARHWRHQKIRRRRPDILRTIELGYSNARLEAFNSRIKVTIRTAYGFHHANNLIALIMLRCGGLDIRLPQPRTQPTKTAEASYVLDISVQGGRCNRSITV